MDVDIETLQRELIKAARPGFDPEREARHVASLLSTKPIGALLQQYRYKRFIAAGGSGLVFEAIDSTSKTERAVKFSRVGAASEATKEHSAVDVVLEIEALSLVNHQNVTRFYGGALTDQKHYAIITQLVKEPLSISEWLESAITLRSDPGRDQDAGNVHADHVRPVSKWDDEVFNGVFSALGEKLHGYAAALFYMHSQCDLFHMDVKPGNLLVGANGTPYLTDLGFARCKRHYSPDAKVQVGFTFGFQHPDFGEKYRILVPESLNKAWAEIPISDLNSRFDLFSFGRTILALLKLLQDRFGERVDAHYGYCYLHLLASLLLDARNVPITSTTFVSEVALSVTGNLLRTFRYTSFSSVVDRLERFLGKRPIEYRFPELNRWHPKTLNHGTGTMPLSSRVASIIRHPAFRRLRKVAHLSTVSEVYLGATHTRYAHCLGVTGVVCECLAALYNEPENPIFKVLVTDDDVKAMILAALLHDLGQSEFGHELEEIDHSVYNHTLIADLILSLKEYKDREGRTLRQIIEGESFPLWSSSIEAVRSILEMTGEAPHFLAFQQLLNSPIDADKIDYLVRDGINCNTPYPRGLDFERFLRCITVLPVESRDGDNFLSLGIKEKGLASSTVITLARHQMYQAVYLHHAARDLKAMVMTSCAQAHVVLVEMVKSIVGPMFAKDVNATISEMFACHLTGQVPAFAKFPPAPKGESTRKKLDLVWHRIVDGHAQCLNAGLDFDRSLSFFYAFANERTKRLFRDFSERNVYKRLFEVSFASISPDEVAKMKSRLSWNLREKTLRDLSQQLKMRARKKLEGRATAFLSLNADPAEAITYLSSEGADVIVADLPLRELGPGGKPPPVLKDISRKRGEYRPPSVSADGLGHIWRSGMVIMMNEISVCRVYCEPEFHRILSATLKQQTINKLAAHILWDQPLPESDEE